MQMRLVLLQFNYRKHNRALHMHEIARKIPLNRLLLETDAPYFAPCASAAALPKFVLMESSRWGKFQLHQFKKISQDRLCPAWPRPPGGRCSCLPQGCSVEKGCWQETLKNSSFYSILCLISLGVASQPKECDRNIWCARLWTWLKVKTIKD